MARMKRPSSRETSTINNKKPIIAESEEKSQNDTKQYSIHIEIPAEQYTNLLRKSNLSNLSVNEMITSTIKKLLQ